MKGTHHSIFSALMASCIVLIDHYVCVALAFTAPVACGRHVRRLKGSRMLTIHLKNLSEPPSYDAEVVQDDMNDDEFDWMTDREKARIAQESRWKAEAAAVTPSEDGHGNDSGTTSTDKKSQRLNDRKLDANEPLSPNKKRLTYTEEEEELIELLGGKDPDTISSKRESGFLGDCTLKEIALDYQVPICYLGDVLCSWDVPPPIDANGLLGDMVTGEQAFAILEAIHTLDMGALNERYADYDLATLCNEYDIPLTDGFEMAMKNGWHLPFGVRTFLRVDQEDQLIESLAKDVW